MSRFYTGIGSRSTPAPVLDLFTQLASSLARAGWHLRSGGAEGADTAFELGALGSGRERAATIYLPWQGFNHRPLAEDGVVRYVSHPSQDAIALAAQHHPRWESLGQGARKLHARNVHQVLGDSVVMPVPSRFVVCWTPEGSGSGGTGQALRIARAHGVEVFDAAIPEVLERLQGFLRAS